MIEQRHCVTMTEATLNKAVMLMQMCAALVQCQVHLVRALRHHLMRSVLHFRLMPCATLEVWPVNQQGSLLQCCTEKYSYIAYSCSGSQVQMRPACTRVSCRCQESM